MCLCACNCCFVVIAPAHTLKHLTAGKSAFQSLHTHAHTHTQPPPIMEIWRSLTVGTIVLLAIVCFYGTVESCNEVVCASIVSKCMLTQSCKCELKNCSCCKECLKCLGKNYEECCSCVGKEGRRILGQWALGGWRLTVDSGWLCTCIDIDLITTDDVMAIALFLLLCVCACA